MTRRLALALALAAGCDPTGDPAAPALPPVDKPSEYVVPFIGSGGFGYHHGAAFPGALSPQGLVKVGPDTRGPFGTINFLHYSGYWYGDNIVQGFSHMHLHGTGLTDYGVLALMPLDGFDASRATIAGYESPFQKASEQAAPGYYAVTLDRGGIRVELTAATHAAHHRYTFAKGAARHVVVDLGHHLNEGRVDSAEVHLGPAERSLTGRLRSIGQMSGGFGGADVFFVIRTRQAWTAQQVWSGGAAPRDGTDASGKDVGLALAFAPAADGEPVEVQVGLSLVSIEGAAANLARELPSWEFDAARGRAEADWDQLLSAVRIEGGTAEERRVFYTALYHAFLMPTIHSDADGRYRGHDDMLHQADGFRFVSDMSLWDTYRTVHPLYGLLAPDRALDAVRSLHEIARQTGVFPKWSLAGGDSGSMVGASAEIVVADAYLRGVRGFDAAGAYQILRGAAMSPVPPAGGRGGRGDVESYMRLGYVPAGEGASISLTTEYGREDNALGLLAGALSLKDDADALARRSLGYRQLFDPQAGFLRPKRADGSFPEGRFDPLCFCSDFAEANAWQSTWTPSYDVAGLIALYGSKEAFVARLGELFERGRQDYELTDPKTPAAGTGPRFYYWHGNEPSIHTAYLFAAAGRPDLTQRWVRWAMATMYDATPGGLTGNDDGGTLSSWYVFSALGLYPEPGTDRYTIGVPLFPRAQLRLKGGTFTIEAQGLSGDNAYVQSVELDGQRLTSYELRHADLRPGGTLRFVMGPPPPG